YPIRISPTEGFTASTPGSFDDNSLSPLTALRESAEALPSASNRMPTLQPPGSEASAPPSQPVTELEPSAPRPPSLNGLPLSFCSGGMGSPSFSPFGAVHCDLPLIEITDMSVRSTSLFQTTSRRRFGSFG